MKISEWIQRYAEQIKRIAPETTDKAAVYLAIVSLGAQIDAKVITDLPPEDYADADTAYQHGD